MATTDDMRDQIRSLESKFDGLEKKVDQLPTRADLSRFATKDDLSRFATKDDLSEFATKDDLSGFATKADLSAFATRDDLVTFKDEISNNFRILAEDAKESATKAAEGFGATLDRIETDLADLNKRMATKFSDHDKVLGNHSQRLVTLERARGRSRRG